MVKKNTSQLWKYSTFYSFEYNVQQWTNITARPSIADIDEEILGKSFN